MRILGSAAGGGFPQWNCNCPNCRAVRSGSPACRPRTQSSIAVSADYENWFLFNVAPDVRGQIDSFSPLWPRDEVRHTPIQAVVLSDAELDHTLGLLSLREARSLRVYATPWVHTALTEWNPLLRTLESFCQVIWQPVTPGQVIPLCILDGGESGLRMEAIATSSSKSVAFAPEDAEDGDASVGYRITQESTGYSIVYLPAVQEINAAIWSRLRDCACLLFDGTCWHDDELPRLGISQKTARSMGHLPIDGGDGSLEQLAPLDIDRKIYIHINNTNPLLIKTSPERRMVEARGIEVAHDGMEVEI